MWGMMYAVCTDGSEIGDRCVVTVCLYITHITDTVGSINQMHHHSYSHSHIYSAHISHKLSGELGKVP